MEGITEEGRITTETEDGRQKITYLVPPGNFDDVISYRLHIGYDYFGLNSVLSYHSSDYTPLLVIRWRIRRKKRRREGMQEGQEKRRERQLGDLSKCSCRF